MRIGALKLKVQIYCGDMVAMGPGKADLLDAIVHIESPNRNTAISSSSLWGAVKLQLHTKSMHELQQQ